MLDVVFENVHCDFSYVYSGALNGSTFSLSVGLCENYASWYQSQAKAMNKSLSRMMEKARAATPRPGPTAPRRRPAPARAGAIGTPPPPEGKGQSAPGAKV